MEKDGDSSVWPCPQDPSGNCGWAGMPPPTPYPTPGAEHWHHPTLTQAQWCSQHGPLLTGRLRLAAYVLPVKVEMEMVIQQYEKAKVIQDEQLERLTQICQEQGVSNCGHAHFCPFLSGCVQGAGAGGA